ncbi:MAG: Flp pilus assembly protein CpaB [Rhodobacterales bacterium 32-67-9]|nr:MAG: Flp pilus assembly protein CpaB [Rhodobacterales bacterium 32-67-9]
MRSIFYVLAALLAFGMAYYYYQDVVAQTATVRKLRLVAEDGLVIRAGTKIDDAFIEKYVVSQEMPQLLEAEFQWVLDDNAATRINLRGRVFGADVPSGSFLQRAQFFVAPENAFARRIRPGNRAFSIPVEARRAVEKFIAPGARVDVIGTFEVSQNQSVAKLLLEDIEVMAVGEIDSRGEYETQDRPDYNSVTLQAPAAAVESFLAAAEDASGGLTLVLRNPCEGADDCIAESVGQ